MDLLIRAAVEADAERITAIYNWYVENGTCTFETAAVRAEEMRARIREKLETHHWLVGEQAGTLVGYAYYGPFRPRAAYSHTAESTVYVAREQGGKGFGTALYANLIATAKRKRVRELVAVIALPNPASIKLHKAMKFKRVGVLEGIGHKFGQYIDVCLWQRSLAKG